MPQDIVKLAKHYMCDPAKILITKEELTLHGMKQYNILIEKEEWKMDVLLELYDNIDINQALIFCNTKKRVIEVANMMNEHDYRVSTIYAEMDQMTRDAFFKEFRSVLITTDILTCGIDFLQVDLVINYDLPIYKGNYIHRISRACIYGRKGTAINFVTPKDFRFIMEIEEHFNIKIEELPQDLNNICWNHH